VEARIGARRGVATVQVDGAGMPSVAAAPTVQTGSGVAALLRVQPGNLFLLPGEAVRLSTLFLRDDGSAGFPQRVTWKTMAPAVASVDAEGQVVGISAGQGVIEAVTANGLVARVPVQVSLAGLSITRSVPGGLSPGMVDTLNAVVPEQANRAIASSLLQWRSSDDNVARVSPFGVVTAVGGGRAEIIASGFLQEARISVTVHKAIEFLRLAPPARDTVRIPLGGVQQFMGEGQAADGSIIPDAQIRFLLLDSSVVSFDARTGLMRPKRVGTTKLRVSAGQGLDTAWTVAVIAGGIRINSHRAGLGVNDRLNVQASYIDDAGRAVGAATGLRWTTSAPNVAQVDNEGNVVAAGFGRANIIAATPWMRSDTLAVFVQAELLVTSNRAGNLDLYAFNRQSPASVNRLTTDVATETSGSFSADGTQIVYVSTRDGNQELYAMDADGSNIRRLTSTPAQEDTPEWTPDGRHIVYASNATGSYQVWIMNADGSEQRRLTEGPQFNFHPAVSPDGKTIGFASTRDDNYEIYLMDLDGQNQRNATRTPGKETTPFWFPDGRLGYLRESRLGTGRNAATSSAVMRVGPPGGQPEQLTPPELVVTDVAVSRDGGVLALVVSAPGPRNTTVTRMTLFPLAPGGTPVDIPAAVPGEQLFAPAFRR
jgi:Tol biopolymer transport system component